MAKMTMREAIPQALMEEMDRDPAVFIMGEEVGVWGGTYAVTKGFYDKYGFNDLSYVDRRKKDRAFGRFLHTYKKRKDGRGQD